LLRANGWQVSLLLLLQQQPASRCLHVSIAFLSVCHSDITVST
jgi:hypothetical protein